MKNNFFNFLASNYNMEVPKLSKFLTLSPRLVETDTLIHALFFSPVRKIQVYNTEQDHSTTGAINDICDPFIIIFLDEITWKTISQQC